jgi:hypothetical protein
MVKTKEIGQSAVLLPKFAMIEYGRHSTTEREWVGYDGFISPELA